MSELKAYTIYEGDVGNYTEHVVYSKSEADEAIADLEESHKKEVEQLLIEIAELNAQVDFLKTTHDSCGNCNKCADGMGKVFDEELNKWKMRLRHQKYKRCLDKAELCRLEQERIELIENQDITDDDFDKLVKGFYKKWCNRWLELAEKFKPNNE